MEALKVATFPPYPAEMVGAQEDFNLPEGFIDKDAPESAQKWCVHARAARAPGQRYRRASALIPRTR